MIPIPVIVLLGIIGLFLYAAIGACVSFLWLRMFGPKRVFRHIVENTSAYISSGKYAWSDVIVLTILWPIILVGILIKLFFTGPCRLVKKIVIYLAQNSLERSEERRVGNEC